MVELPAVDAYHKVDITQPTKHTANKAETGASQVQIPPARPEKFAVADVYLVVISLDF